MGFRNLVLLLSIASLSVLGGGCSGLLYHPTHETHLEPAKMGLKHEEIWIEGRHAWRFPSATHETQGLVVFFHGNGENLSSHFSSLAWLPSRGYEYLIFDYRGYGKTPGNPSPESTVQDGVAVLRWALSTGRPLALLGQSLGGAVLLRSLQEIESGLAEKDRARIRWVAIDSSFRSYRSAGQFVLKRAWLTWPFQWVPHLVLSDRYAAAPEQRGGHPWLVMHGTEDEVISPKLGLELYESLPEPKRWMLVPGAGHIQGLWMQAPDGSYPWREKFLAMLDESMGSPRKPVGELAYRLPFAKGASYEVLQGPGGSFSHEGEQYFAVDFFMPVGTPVLAMRGGKVIRVIDENTEGGPSSAYALKANRILIEHDDKTLAEYVHLAHRGAKVREGGRVEAGSIVGLSGNTGFSSAPHLHVRLYTARGSFPIVFEVAGGAARVLATGDLVRAP